MTPSEWEIYLISLKNKSVILLYQKQIWLQKFILVICEQQHIELHLLGLNKLKT